MGTSECPRHPLNDDVHISCDAARRGVVDPIAHRVGRTANGNITERFRIHLATLVVKKMCKRSATEHLERRSVLSGACE
jgi:hypothetical protein